MTRYAKRDDLQAMDVRWEKAKSGWISISINISKYCSRKKVKVNVVYNSK